MHDRSRPHLGRRFLTVWVGQTLSGIGSTMSAVGVAVYVFLETGSAVWLGVLSALSAIPVVLVAPFRTSFTLHDDGTDITLAEEVRLEPLGMNRPVSIAPAKPPATASPPVATTTPETAA